jgi:hypothetical protein
MILINVLYINKKEFVHQVGDQTRLFYDARSTNHQGTLGCSVVLPVPVLIA